MPRFLGIDPGLRITGYGVVHLPDAEPGGYLPQPTLLEGGVIRLDAKLSVEKRLVHLYRDLREVIEEAQPDHVAVEKLYAHYAHPRTAILMAHARGVILLAAQQQGLPVQNLPATEVKKAVTGHGHASKEQMQLAVQAQCKLAEPPSPPDVADAIAIALCAARRASTSQL